MKIAILTICHNEHKFLPMWKKYYKNIGDLHVILHNCDRQFVNDNYNEIYQIIETNDEMFNHTWLRDTVEKHHRRLLKEYDIVIYAEPDEMIIHPHVSLNKYLRDEYKKGFSIIQTIGYDIVEEHGINKIVRHAKFDKPIITTVPVNWSCGFHKCNDKCYQDNQLHLMHFHRVCRNYAFEKSKYQSTLNISSMDRVSGMGKQNYIKEPEEFIEWYERDRKWWRPFYPWMIRKLRRNIKCQLVTNIK